MPRWKALPDSQDQRVRQLVVQLRRLKDRSGLSLVSLAAKTGYSRSSWDRYLNGQALPPRRAVEELARAAGADPIRLLVLHEVAEEAWQQPVTPPPAAGAKDAGRQEAPGQEVTGPIRAAEAGAEPAEGPADAEARSPAVGAAQPWTVRKSVALAAVVTVALVGMGAGMLIAAPWGEDDGTVARMKSVAAGPVPSSSPAGAAQGPGRYVFQPGKSYPCKVREADEAGGGLYAGYSTTRTAVLAGPGWDVVEAQCLLSHRRLNPGTVDGVYGQQTIAAVMRLQKKAGLPADGVAGPHTWQELRR
ncbi:helix-turn-helix domain-containing protein [Streptomyces sp. NPDC058221]|uniref:helix-turn-helix domain-containing protein n=1 Tax=Streptomyces sp. NPDC058221 TaxID=3346388 RepID=UPI0036E53DA5